MGSMKEGWGLMKEEWVKDRRRMGLR